VTLYLDTSALVKLYVTEDGSATVRSWVDDAQRIVTACITYAEARAALARSRRLGTLGPSDLRRATSGLDADWRGYGPIDVHEALAVRAGQLAEQHGLSGYDAVHLAAALATRPDVGDYVFASFDEQLNAAASREGLPLAAREGGVRDALPAGYRPRTRLRVAASGRSR
jgi:predicted nucleic acid-binding protein